MEKLERGVALVARRDRWRVWLRNLLLVFLCSYPAAMLLWAGAQIAGMQLVLVPVTTVAVTHRQVTVARELAGDLVRDLVAESPYLVSHPRGRQVQGLGPADAAWAIGLRNGDIVRSWDAHDRRMRLNVDRAGHALELDVELL